MNKHLLCLLAVVCCNIAVPAQVLVVNPQNLDVPQQKASVIYHTTLRVLAENFDTGEVPELFPLTLVLGDNNERYVDDEDNKMYAIYLAKWNEKKFAISVMRLALEHLVDQDCRNQIVSEILTRSDVIAPVAHHPEVSPSDHHK